MDLIAIAQKIFDETLPHTTEQIPFRVWCDASQNYFLRLASLKVEAEKASKLPPKEWMDSYINGDYSPGSGITSLPEEQRDMILSGWTIGVKGATNDKGFTDLEEQRKLAKS